jgi:hypothetical protein
LKTKTPRTANIELLKYEGAEKYDTDTENNKSGDNIEQYLGGEKKSKSKSKTHRKSKRYRKRKTCRKSK